MAVLIGKDNSIQINEDVFNTICKTLKRYHYETGGIIGTNENGVVSMFQFDYIQNPNFYEYYPNIKFLNRVINEEWKNKSISFVGFVHSHLHNCEISKQDIEYARHILANNKSYNTIILGIVDLSKKSDFICWYSIEN